MFPALLTKAVFDGNRVMFWTSDLKDGAAYMHYLKWKHSVGVGEVLTVAKLRQLYRRQSFVKPISTLFEKNSKIDYLRALSTHQRGIGVT